MKMHFSDISFLKLDDWIVEPLAAHHRREVFDCSVESLNMYLRRQAGQNTKRDYSRTFVAVSETASPDIAGYYTLTVSAVPFKELPREKHLPRYPVPVAHLGRLAVDVGCRGHRVGEFLLFHALWRVQELSEQIGIDAVQVRALDETVSQFYTRYGFAPLADDPRHLYLALKSIRHLGLK